MAVDAKSARLRYLFALMRGDRPFLGDDEQRAIGLTQYGNEQPFARDDYRHPSLFGVGPKDSGLQALIDTPKRYDEGYSYGIFNNDENAQAFSDDLFRMMRLHYERGQHQAQGANAAGLLPSGRAWEADNPPPRQDQLPPLPRDTHNRPITGQLMRTLPTPIPQAAYSPRVAAIRRTGRKFT